MAPSAPGSQDELSGLLETAEKGRGHAGFYHLLGMAWDYDSRHGLEHGPVLDEDKAETATFYLQRAMESNPLDWRSRQKAGLRHYMRKEWADAADHWGAAASLRPNSFSLREAHAQALADDGRTLESCWAEVMSAQLLMREAQGLQAQADVLKDAKKVLLRVQLELKKHSGPQEIGAEEPSVADVVLSWLDILSKIQTMSVNLASHAKQEL